MTHIVVQASDNDSTSPSLLDDACSGQVVAWRQIVNLYEPLVKRWCRQEGLRDADTDDAWHEVLLALVTHLRQFERKKKGAFRCWLRAITRTKIADIRRQELRLPTQGGTDVHQRLLDLPALPSHDLNHDFDAEEAGILYRRALDLLQKDFASRTWRAFWGVVIEGRSPADVAADLGISRNAVFLARARVLNRLREEFKDFIDE